MPRRIPDPIPAPSPTTYAAALAVAAVAKTAAALARAAAARDEAQADHESARAAWLRAARDARSPDPSRAWEASQALPDLEADGLMTAARARRAAVIYRAATRAHDEALGAVLPLPPPTTPQQQRARALLG